MPALPSVEKNRRAGIERKPEESRRRAEDVAEGIGRKAVAGEDDKQRSGRGQQHHRQHLAAASFGHPQHEHQAQQRRHRQRRDVRGGRHAKRRREQHDARPPFAPRSLHGMGHADAGVDAAIDAQRGQHLGIGRNAGLEHRGRKAVERQRRVAAQIAVEPPRHPPESTAQQAAGQQETAAATAAGCASSGGATPMC